MSNIAKHVRLDCRFFKGDVPCIYHKRFKVKCKNCKYYDKINKRILIVKLGRAGDVIRTTPILRKIKKRYPHAEISWVTSCPEMVPSLVDNIVDFNLPNTLWLLAQKFDLIFNFDKEKEGCSLAELIRSKARKGFGLKNGKCVPVDDKALHKWKTGLWDDMNRKNKKSYPKEIFELCGFAFKKEKYILDRTKHTTWPVFKHPLVGLNTGCGDQWKTREWPEKKWIELARRLKKEGYGVLILGGEKEHNKNKEIARKSGGRYLGHFPPKKFIELVDQTDLVVTVVTMTLHLAIALEKKVVLLNNIFNRNEFELYGLGEIIEPSIDCLDCYKSECDIKFNGKKCMDLINANKVFGKCKEMLSA